ncbi:hypothetical protein COCNU_01G020330 [Cocos nucifera]|uniref:Uncharacterized protein n=1 Tax=Cocos nucifera TaxID=13894 RepID=A0A8K0HXP7_COCNU|nr:hypothetical protein COCNU_01G020330 [Cocos nucifera]
MDEDKGGTATVAARASSSSSPVPSAPPPPVSSFSNPPKEAPPPPPPEATGQRQRFTVELRSGETTIVSWKRLLRETGKGGGGDAFPPSGADPALGPHAGAAAEYLFVRSYVSFRMLTMCLSLNFSVVLFSLIELSCPSIELLTPLSASELSSAIVGVFWKNKPVENELTDAVPPSNRFSAVIEKIERLYMGKQSSDEEDLDDTPDDDQYDTEDSFIDDAELVSLYAFSVCHRLILVMSRSILEALC